MKLFFFTLLLICLCVTGYCQANTNLSNLVSPTSVNQSLIPSSSNSKDLGSSSLNWRNVYFKGTLYKGSQRILSNGGFGNTFVGIQSGLHNSNGTGNTAVGDSALMNNTWAYANTAVGAFSLYKNTTGNENTAVGYGALDSNTTGYANTAIGRSALSRNTTGSSNTASGFTALISNTTGSANVATGYQALVSNTTGGSNTAIGYVALASNATGYGNTAIGDETLLHNTTGQFNSVSGTQGLYNNTTGINNTASGYSALYNNRTGNGNTATGYWALYNNNGGYNTAVGYNSLAGNTSGSVNVGMGYYALANTTTGGNNTALGFYAGVSNTINSNNTFVGSNTDATNGLSNVTVLGANAYATASNQVRIGSSSVTSIGGQVNWTAFSDGRYKQNIKEDVHGLDFINSLRPITYTVDVKSLNAYYGKSRKQPEGISVDEKQAAQDKEQEERASQIVYNGFIAQEVEKAAQNLKYNFSGVDKPQNATGLYGLRYSDFVVPLVRAVQQLDSSVKAKDDRINQQQQQIDALTERLNKLEAAQNSSSNLTLNSASLEQNTPNPVSGTTIIRYHLPHNTTGALLNITNTKGQLVKTISLTSSMTQLNLNTSMLASGTYNYTLMVDGKQVDTKRLVIAR